MPVLEIVILIALFALSIWLISSSFEAALSVLLFLSILLHKEFFSIYRWDVLPSRVFMLAFSAYFGIQFLRKFDLKKTIEHLKKPFIAVLVAYWVVAAISLIFTKNVMSSVLLFGFFSTMMVLGITLFLKLKDQPEKVLKLIKTYFYIGFGLSIFGFIQLFIYQKFDFIFGALWNIPSRLPRIGATFWDVNHFAALLAALLPVLGMFILVEKTWKKKLWYSVVLIVMTVMLLMTNGRSAWIIAAVALLVFAVTWIIRKWGFKGIYALLAVLLLISGALAWEYSDRSSPFRAKVRSYFHYRLDSFDSHFLLLEGAWQIFETNPYFGGGMGGFFEHFKETKIAPTYFGRDPVSLTSGFRVPGHSIWGELAAETGIAGISVFVLLNILILGTLFYVAMLSEDKKEWMLSAGMGASLLGWLVGGIFYSYKAEFFWLIFFLYFIYGVGALGGKLNLTEIFSYYFRINRTPIIVLGTIAAVLIFIGLGQNHFIPWDEAIYGKIAKNIVALGDPITLRWETLQTLWFEKPPLYMWVEALSMKLLGVSEFAARLPSALLGFGSILLAYQFGKKMFGKLAGFFAALTLLTSVHFLYYSRVAMLDISVTFFVALGLYFYWCTLEDRTKYRNWILAGASIGLAAMIKNVVGFLPLVVIGLNEIYLILTKSVRFDGRLIKQYLTLGILSLLVFLPWHIVMLAKYGRGFIDEYFIYHILTRGTTAIENKGNPFWWYIIVLKVSMRIWFVALLGALPFGLFKSLKKNSRKYTFLLIWAFSMLLFFSAAQSKLVWYILPLYPALALMIGGFIDHIFDKLPFNWNMKALTVYGITVFSLFYLFLVKDFVYTDDFTKSQAVLLQKKDEEFGIEDPVYADKVELPLIYFYTDGPFVGVDATSLKTKLKSPLYEEPVIFITKEGRYQKLIADYPEVALTQEHGDFVLAHYPSQYERDIDELELIDEELEILLHNIGQAELAGVVVPATTRINASRLMSEKYVLEEKIELGLQNIDTDFLQ